MINLTGHNYSSHEIIQNIFSPLVGVISSPLAAELCHRNNLSFVELLQPFAKLPNDAQFRDVSGTSVSIRRLRLNFCDVNWRPPQTVLARKMLNEGVSNSHNDKRKFVPVAAGSMEVEIPSSEPWFEQWRETFLTVQFPADHEFTRHFLGCLMILSSGDPNIVETAQKFMQTVQQMQSVTPQKLPKWFYPSNVLNSFVVLHEGSQGDLSKAQQGYELLKSTFGDNKCFLIQINSLDGTVASELPDYWAPFIKRQPKSDINSEQISGPKTPQDGVSVIAMPTMQMSNLIDSIESELNAAAVAHPLSPMQESATEAINSKFSVSSESIASQNINPNVWASAMGTSATQAENFDIDSPHGACMNAMDVENLRHFVQDYALRALIPYVENLVAILSEAITNKKGVSKSLLSATKRWFITSKPGVGSNQNAVIYTQESSELQTRKLGDLYFMFGHYNLAFQSYHQAKRDFNADSAWQYYAGALEMAAVSAFMLGTANRKTYDYMEDAIVSYLTVCKLQQFATRATLLSMECLKTARLYGEAAKQLIRMTSEESDLRSALLLEQAAYCYLASQPQMPRKYAFHIVLAGNRYSRTGQRKHAYRCYRQAYQVFENRGWSLAEDHIQYTMAKQAYSLKKLDDASSSFAHLLRPGSLQSAQQQASFIKEYIQTQNEYLKRSPEVGLQRLALPSVLQQTIRVLVGVPPALVSANHAAANSIDILSTPSNDHVWSKMEEMLATTAASNKPFVFKPSRCLFTKEHPSSEPPQAVQGEPLELCVTLQNTVKLGITLTDIDLLWKLTLDNDEELCNASLFDGSIESSSNAAIKAAIKTSCNQTLVLEENDEKNLLFKVIPKLTGRLNIQGIVAKVATSSEPNATILGSLHFETQIFKLMGKQPNQTAIDSKLCIRIVPSMPSLSVSFSAVPSDLVVGEIIPVTISLRNLGISPIDDVFMGCDNPRWITVSDKNTEVPLSIISAVKDLSNENLVKDKEIRRQHVVHLLKGSNCNGTALKAQECANVSMWIQAPYDKGEFTVRLLFYYGLQGAAFKYRLVRHTWQFCIHEGLRSEVSCVVSNRMSGEMGINVNIKNESDAGLPLELYINSMALYNEQLKINAAKLHLINLMEIEAGKLGDRCLKAAKSVSFQCRLENSRASNSNDNPANELQMQHLLKSRLSSIEILPTIALKEHQIPPLQEWYSFLAKNETTFFNTSISAEEFNSLVKSSKPHATVVLNWTANVGENTRETHGQHFVQLKNLYEIVSCPVDNFLTTNSSENVPILIADYANHKSDGKEQAPSLADLHEINGSNVFEQDAEEQEYWADNDNNVGVRCLLEDESFIVALKA